MSTTLLTLTLALAQFPATPENRADAAMVRASDVVAQAAREFRNTVYANFRTDRPEFDHRWQAGETLWRQWSALNQPIRYSDAVRTWFAEAAEASRTGDWRELPPLPKLPEPTLTTALEGIATPPVEEDAPPAPVLTPPALPTAGDDAEDADSPFLPAPKTGREISSEASAPVLPAKIRGVLDVSESLFGGWSDTP